MNDSHIVTEEQAGIRLDKVLRDLFEQYSRQQLQTWIKGGHFKVNDMSCKPNYICNMNDIILWTIPDEKEEVEVHPENIPLTILYEDKDLLVVNKPKGMLVHPTKTVKTNTLVNALKYHCDTLSNLSGEDRPGIVHRLDQDTSGLLIIAKNNGTHEKLKEQFKQQTVIRLYEAIVYGVMEHNQGIIQAPIGRNPKNRLQRTVISSGKDAETHFRVIQRLKQYTHVECELKTGRTHQIRVHMKYMNHPVVGDPLYVRKKSGLIKGQALFAKKVIFEHPHLKESMSFQVDQPTEFKNLLERLEQL